ncbi:DNA phosphorothioation system sulfurtransferase DndC [Ohessyouella blattaphilus]|uniref:DNA phosphorothioation system sulfurtransferase DndC n=1 Tax=Ohessyouella blattaphilus TaxID=2949333 RepID=A0ABT1EJK8_9FIRM|nr:DNA phosphorothioation system sulfurtransferase DndC [Ohessyouella blattaphilus]MCP1110890.1 DNA phosphorothioation system sulfurtransferase DndC [Ohessyouella blattaphilus]MCR8564284.1 DNA phosphorothioation system sulfurtransferase DndC [Ohessyouella blattaphilus]
MGNEKKSTLSKAKQTTTLTRDTVEGLMSTVRNLYLADDIPWVIGYSGGKDSTATLQLVWLSLREIPEEQRTKTIHIINTDTMVESPVIEKWVERSLKIMDEAAEKEGLPFVTHKLTPDLNNTFWVNFLGRGYPFPRKKLRWCTDRLKIQPVNTFVKRKIAEHGEIILVLGTRKAESSNRAKTMANYEKKRVRELLSPNPTMANELVFSPLEEWTDNDVWVFLMQYKNPWGFSNNELLTLYRGATADNECPMMVEKDLPSCGKSRFGCWVCTMVEKDKSMEAMIANDGEKAWMTPLLEFRNKFGDEENDRDRRSFKKMQGYLQGTYGRLHHGPYKKKVREEWLEELLEIQKNINENGPEEFRDLELITIPELRNIRRIWVRDKHEFDDALPKIYERVMGVAFEDAEWIGSEAYGQEEWNLLSKICSKKEHKNEEQAFELLYSLIDIENQSNSLNQRKGILDSLETCIKHNFYKNEDDATEYYTRQLERKKTMGGKYNEKFFAHIQEEGGEFEDVPEEAEAINR